MLLRLLLLVSLSTSSATLMAQCWNLVWNDEFTGTTLDNAKWSYDQGNGCPGLCGWGNGELEYYTNSTQNVSVSGGYLNLTAKYSANYLSSGSDFTSGKIHTRNSVNWKYGKFEASIKLPAGTGCWPAFWMLPQNNVYGGWPTSGEIDIMENRGDQVSTCSGTLHYGNASPNNKYDGTAYSLSSGDFVNSFHTFTVEWEPAEIRWYIDGVLYKTETKTPNSLNPASNNAVVWPWDQEFYLILNLAVGGWYSGGHNAATIIGGNTSWSKTMQVDYVRVYTDLSNGSLTGNISGKSSVLTSETGLTYSIPANAGASYAWQVPSDASITAGQNTDQVTVNWGSKDSVIKVTKTVACGSAEYTLNVTTMPTACGTIGEDYEQTRITNLGYINGQYYTKVLNPAKTAQNNSPYCARYDRNPTEQYDVLILLDVSFMGNLDDLKSGVNKLLMDVYSNAAGRNIDITLENNTTSTGSNYPTGRFATFRATTGAANAWETLTFNLLSIPDPGTSAAQVNQITLLFSPNTYTNTTFYIDNFMLDKQPVASAITGSSTLCFNDLSKVFSVSTLANTSFAWTLPSGASLSAGAGTNSVSVNFGTTSGNITVTPTRAGCIGKSSTKTVTLQNCLADVLDDQKAEQLPLYPNPAETEVLLTAPEEGFSPAAYAELRDLSGKSLMRFERTQLYSPLNISALPQGLYLIHINDGAKIYNSRFSVR